MSGDKTIVYTPESGGGSNGMMAMLAPLLQKSGIDPNLLLAMNGKNGNGGFGGDGSFLWIIFLFFLFPLMGGRNGGLFGGGGNDGGSCCNPCGAGGAGLANLINNDNGRELLMSAIQGNGNAISSLATTLNCSIGQINQAICGLGTQIQSVGNQVGMSSQQVINSIQQGNCQLAGQLSQCCCDVKNAIERQGYEGRIATIEQTQVITSQSDRQFNVTNAKIDAQTQLLNDKFCQLEMREMQNKIETLRAEKAALELGASQLAQTRNIIDQIRPCPIPSYPVCNPWGYNGVGNAPYGYNGGCNDGCGCGNG